MWIAESSAAFSIVTPEPHVRELKVLLSPSLQEGVQDLAVGMTLLPQGRSSSLHAHESESETWIVVQGTGEVVVGDESRTVGPETVVHIPAGFAHQIRNTGTQELRMFWIYTPPGGERAVLDADFS